MVEIRKLLKIAEAAHTVVVVGGQDLGVLADVLLADVALDLVCRVEDVLG